MLIISSILLSGSILVILRYYSRISSLSREYNNAKGIVKNIVVSVDKQFKKQKDRMIFVVQAVENILVENKKVEKKIELYNDRLNNITKIIDDVPRIEERFSGPLKELQHNLNTIKENQEKVIQRLENIEKIRPDIREPEVKIEAAIPIKKEKALAPLTETELSVLEIIDNEGEKTAPEIRKIIGLTREHTARLMKKLYKDGYLERDTHKMPYYYRLKEEMQKILKKRKTEIL